MSVTASSVAAPSAPQGAIAVLAGEGPIFRPSVIEIPTGAFQIFVSSPPVDPNAQQAVPHNLGIRAPGTLDVIARSDFVMPGESIVLTVSGLEPGTYQFVCEVQGHAGAGMVGTLTVGDG
jgi:plastocyanin